MPIQEAVGIQWCCDKGTNFVSEAEYREYHEYGMFNLSYKPIEVTVLVEQRTVTIEVDIYVPHLL